MAAPKIKHMAQQVAHAGLVRACQIEEIFEASAAAAEVAFLSQLDESEKVRAMAFIRSARQAAEDQWARAAVGNGTPVQAPPVDTSFDGAGGDEGNQAPGSDHRRLTIPHLQKELSKLLDCTRLRSLQATLALQCNWAQLERLRDLRRPEVSHKWIKHLDSRKGSVLAQCDYTSGIRRRLGARMYDGDQPCRICGSPLDTFPEHGECCATAEATRGRYACV